MNLFIALVVAGISFLLSLFVYYKNSKSATNVYFAALLLFLGLYPIFNYLSLNSLTPEEAFFWSKLILLTAIPAGPLFYFFVKTFPKNNFISDKKIQYPIIAWTLINVFLALNGLIFKSVHIINGNPQILPGPAVASFALLQILSILAGSLELFKKFKNSTGLLRVQLRFITFGILLSFGLTLLSTVIFPLLFKITIFISLSPLFLIISALFISYSILRHRLLDIRLVVARTVSYAVLVGIFGLIYSLLFAVSSSFFISYSIEDRTITISTALALLMAFSFQAVRKEIEHTTDKFLYKDHYDSNKLLYDLTLIMASTLKFEDLSHQFLLTLMSQMRVSKGAIILKSEDRIFDVSHEGYNESPSYKENMVFFLIEQNKLLVFDELDESEAKSFMREMNISIAVDIATAGQQIGLFTLGEKLSGDIYTSEDIKVIEILVPELAVAIKNSLSYDEISRFNITLKDEIDEATANLRQANEKLKELDKLKDEFVSVASHELRTPMTAIKSYLWMALNKSAKTLDPQVKKDISIAYSSTERLLKLVTDMLTISRIEGKRLLLQKEEFNFNEISQQAYDELKITAAEKEISFVFNLPEKPIIMNGDKEKLREVLQNIIGNALKFTPAKGRISLIINEQEKYLIIDTINSGSYIPPEELPKLFQKFNRLNVESTKKDGAPVGTGLGLYITKQIVEMHNGSIEATSDKKEGTTFHIKIPKNS